MLQQWRDLSFLHFPTDPAQIQNLLPKGLTVDTYPDSQGAEQAWVALVPFRMQGVTPLHFPPIPGCHAFPETNVRTYAHRDGQQPGVWFFSLEATNGFACRRGRRWYGLPYLHASMSVKRDGDDILYHSLRKRSLIGHDIAVRAGAPVVATPGSLEFFLVERYLLYSLQRGKLCTGMVHHTPYPVQHLSVTSCAESLIESNGIEPKPFIHTMFSPGVDVEVFALKPI